MIPIKIVNLGVVKPEDLTERRRFKPSRLAIALGLVLVVFYLVGLYFCVSGGLGPNRLRAWLRILIAVVFPIVMFKAVQMLLIEFSHRGVLWISPTTVRFFYKDLFGQHRSSFALSDAKVCVARDGRFLSRRGPYAVLVHDDRYGIVIRYCTARESAVWAAEVSFIFAIESITSGTIRRSGLILDE